MLVIGNLETETKFAYTTRFTNTYYGIGGDTFTENSLCPRFLLGTPGCIGAGLDCASVNLVCRIGLPSSLIHFIQEMGRCGRSNSNNNNAFTIAFHLNDYVYLVERMYIIDNNSTSSTDNSSESQNSIMTKDNQRQYYTENLNRMCRMLFCDCGCWHVCLELVSANPFSHYQQLHQISPCMNKCPYCDKTQQQYVKKVSKSGLQTFLATTLMCTHDKSFTPASLVKKLIDYPNVGRLIYGRKTAIKIEKSSDAAMTILQLLSCNIIHLYVVESKKPQSICVLSRTDSTPHYLIDAYWERINHY